MLPASFLPASRTNVIKSRFSSISFVIAGATLAVLAGGLKVRAAEPGAKTGLPERVIPRGLGFNIHIRGPESNWDQMKAAGARLIRADFGWNGIEQTKGVYRFRRYDKLLDELDARGIRAIFILDYRNRNYPKPELSEAGRQAYAKWAAASAAHFKGRNVIWEIWNEPNVHFWRGEGELNSREFARQYVALVKTTVPAMRQADPDCFILGGSVSCLWRNSFVWVDEAFQQGLLESGIDALSVHPYGFKRPELCISKHEPGGKDVEGYGYLTEMLAQYKAEDFPVVNTEVGYPANQGNSLEIQAMLFVRTYLIDQMCGRKTTIWYNWDENDAATMRVRSAPGEEPLPVYRACQQMTRELTGYHFVQRLKLDNALDYALAFENDARQRKIVAWTVPPARDDTQDKAIAHEVAFHATDMTAARNLYGDRVEVQRSGSEFQVTLTASPIYLDLSTER